MKKKGDLYLGMQGIFWMGLMSIMSYLIQLIIMYFLARLLSPSDFGEFTAITIFTGIAQIFWMMGVGPAIVQKKDLSEEDITTGNTLNIIMGIIVFGTINLNMTLLVNIFNISNPDMLRLFSPVFLIQSLSGISQSLIQKKCKFKLFSFINFIGLLGYGLSAIIFSINQFGTWALVYSKIIEALIMTFLLLKFEPIKFKIKIHSSSAKKLLYYGGGFSIARFFNYIANNGDYFVVNKAMGKVDLGLYTKAYQLLMYPVNLIGTTLDQVLFPLLSKSQEDYAKLKRVFINGTGLIAFLSVPVSIIAYFSAENLVFFFLGNQWSDTILPFKIMIIGLFFRIGYKLSDSLIRALGQVYKRAVIQFIYAFMIIMGAYLGHFYGLPGVALGVSFSFILNYFLMTILSMYIIKIKAKELLLSVLPAFMYGVVTTIITFYIKKDWVNTSSNFLTILIVVLSVILFYGLLFIFTRKKLMSKELNSMIDSITRQVFSKIKSLSTKLNI
jgi:O-antigen/teichoic acid export membrane protein